MDYVTVPLTHAQIFRGGGRAVARRTVFVAYEFTPRSSQFKADLKEELSANWNVDTLDGGNIPAGVDWSAEVQSRIKRSKLVVADVSNTSREVMFEIGFAGNKSSMYVIHSDSDLERKPRWLTIKQVHSYGEYNIPRIAQTIAAFFDNDRFPRAIQRSTRPGTAVIVRQAENQDWSSSMSSQIEALMRENAVTVNHCDPNRLSNGHDLAGFAAAQFVFAVVDGSSSDYLAHYLLGDVAGRPRFSSTGSFGKVWMQRHGIVISPNEASYAANTADALRRVSEESISYAHDFVSVKATLRAKLAKARQWRAPGEADRL